MEQDERRVAEFFRNKGLIAKEFSSEEKRSKTPDFCVFKGCEFVFFCEVKSCAEDKWLINQVQNAPQGTIVRNARNDPKFNRISNKIHEAYGQFGAVNVRRDYPNVLAFVNEDIKCNAKYLIWVLTGNFYSDDGHIDRIFLRYSRGRISKQKRLIDGYIWVEANNNHRADEYYLFCEADSHFLPKLADLFGLRMSNRKDEKSLLWWRFRTL